MKSLIARFAPMVFGLVGLVVAATGGWAADVPGNSEAAAVDRHIAQLIEQLGDEDYFVRQRAQSELAKMGFDAFDALSAAENHDDLEIATRARYLVRLLQVHWTREDDPPEVKRCLEGYESLAAEQRVEQMRRLSGLPGRVGIPALCRLARFEKSPVLSKRAATEILSRQKPGEPPPAELVETIRQGLGRSRRPAAGWLATYIRFRTDPAEALVAWSKLVDEELETLRRTPAQTSPQVVAELVEIQIHQLAKVGRKQDAVAAMWKLIDLQKGDPQSLQELVEWLVEQSAWDAIEKVAERFPDRFDDDAILLYTLAQAQRERGKTKDSDETAKRALALDSGTQLDDLIAHLMTAFTLRHRGLFAWAEQEYRYVIRSAVKGQNLTATAQFGLSEMLHDQGNDLRAAEVLKPLVEELEKSQPAVEKIAARTPASIRSRMNYFYALHWSGQGDRKKQREYLEAALAADPTDIDVLIGCYRLPEADDAWKAKIRELIRKTADQLREQIAADPEDALYYNQFAWLIGNTEGDFDEALRYSKKSIELEPDAGGYYDTLGRVCYAMGDYANAVKYQTTALEMDPHSGLIRRQWELFTKALEEQRKQGKPSQPSENGGNKDGEDEAGQGKAQEAEKQDGREKSAAEAGGKKVESK